MSLMKFCRRALSYLTITNFFRFPGKLATAHKREHRKVDLLRCINYTTLDEPNQNNRPVPPFVGYNTDFPGGLMESLRLQPIIFGSSQLCTLTHLLELSSIDVFEKSKSKSDRGGFRTSQTCWILTPVVPSLSLSRARSLLSALRSLARSPGGLVSPAASPRALPPPPQSLQGLRLRQLRLASSTSTST